MYVVPSARPLKRCVTERELHAERSEQQQQERARLLQPAQEQQQPDRQHDFDECHGPPLVVDDVVLSVSRVATAGLPLEQVDQPIADREVLPGLGDQIDEGVGAGLPALRGRAAEVDQPPVVRACAGHEQVTVDLTADVPSGSQAHSGPGSRSDSA